MATDLALAADTTLTGDTPSGGSGSNDSPPSAAEQQLSISTSKHIYIPAQTLAKALKALAATGDPNNTAKPLSYDIASARWIPAQVVRLLEDKQILLSVPLYASEQAIACNAGRTALYTQQVAISQDTAHNHLQNVDSDGQLQMVADMVDLSFLHEPAILYNLKARHVLSMPYTKCGELLVAVNPYQWFPNLYSLEQRHLYAKINTDKDVPPPPPHVYETASWSYHGLLSQWDPSSRNTNASIWQDQSILVSGESGAGKTETVKICLHHLAFLSSSFKKEESFSPIVQRILESNPLLEAFGNAQTLRNDNSSRFGKYLQLQFDLHHNAPRLQGSTCQVYLLETARVISQSPGERNFHIFYQMLAAPEDYKTQHIWDGLADTDPESFWYVAGDENDETERISVIEGKTDAERFQMTLQSLKAIGVVDDTLKQLFQTLCVVLTLGNLQLEAIDDDHAKISEETQDDFCALAEELLGLEDPADLAVAVLVRNVTARGETFQVPCNQQTAKESIDALAKAVYRKTFLWLVHTMNAATRAPPVAGRNAYGTIGLLDIFGFETFDVNRFEQLCINYANEKLQQKFTQDIFRSVQAEYEWEGIALEEITYEDNRNVLDLMEGPVGLLALLNEECVRPKGSDSTFVYKAHTMMVEGTVWMRESHWPPTQFGIQHYAGPVIYQAEGFVSKNTDTLPSDLQECAAKSTNPIIAKDWSSDLLAESESTHESATVAEPPATSTKKRPKKRPGSKPPATNAAPQNNRPTYRRTQSSNLVADTVWTKFKSQLSLLMKQLGRTRTRYIRCIKPNGEKKPLLMEHKSTISQLRCAGVVAAVTLARSAFPNRLDHQVVLDRFKSLLPQGQSKLVIAAEEGSNPVQQAVEQMLTVALKDLEFRKDGAPNVAIRAFVMGRSKVYFRAGALEYLEAQRLEFLGVWAVRIQKDVRRFIHKSRYRKVLRLTSWLQSATRMRQCRLRYLQQRQASVSIQCWIRIVQAKRHLVALRRNFRATQIQAEYKSHVRRTVFRKWRRAAIEIQRIAKGALQRPKYRQALKEKAEEAKLENQLRVLQRRLEEAEGKRIQAEQQAVAAAEQKAAEERAALERQQAEREAQQHKELMKKEEEERLRQAQEEQKRLEEEKQAWKEQVLKQQREEQAKVQQQWNEEQQTLMDESGRMLEYLRKEVFKLRNQNHQLKSDFDLLKDNNQRLMDANASAGASFGALNQHAKQLTKQNGKLQEENHDLKTQVQKTNQLLVEAKEELRMKQTAYASEAQRRLQFEKALGKITDILQEQCRDTRLVERILSIADECEMELMDSEEAYEDAAYEDANTTTPTSRKSKGSIFGSLSSYFS